MGGYVNDQQDGDLPIADLGGNSIPLAEVPGLPTPINLHMFWDAGGGLYNHNWPLSPDLKAELSKNASALIQMYPKTGDLFKGRYNTSALTNCWKDTTEWNTRCPKGAGRGEICSLGGPDAPPLPCQDVFELWVNQSYNIAI